MLPRKLPRMSPELEEMAAEEEKEEEDEEEELRGNRAAEQMLPKRWLRLRWMEPPREEPAKLEALPR